MGAAICGLKHQKPVEANMLTPKAGTATENLITENILFTDENELFEDLSLLQISLKCTNLSTEDRFQLLNPIAFLYIEENNEFVKKGETEVIFKTLNPSFLTKFKTKYSLKKDYQLKIEIYDKKKKFELLGSTIFSVHEVAATFQMITKELFNQNKRVGNILIIVEELSHLNDEITMQWAFEPFLSFGYCYLRLSREDCFGYSNVFQSESRAQPYSNK